MSHSCIVFLQNRWLAKRNAGAHAPTWSGRKLQMPRNHNAHKLQHGVSTAQHGALLSSLLEPTKCILQSVHVRKHDVLIQPRDDMQAVPGREC